MTRTFLALAASAAEDLRDRDGIARPLLRRGALRLTTSARTPVQRVGAGYLRYDPPTPEELARVAPPAPPRPTLPAATGEASGPAGDEMSGKPSPGQGVAGEAPDGRTRTEDSPSPAEQEGPR